MIDAPTRKRIPAQNTASIHMQIPVQAMPAEFPKALAEISAALQQQGIAPAGAIFAHHFRRPADTFDFNVCIPVARAITPVSRVEPVSLPALEVVQTTYHGDYAGLPHAWGDFIAQIASAAPALREDFLEAYVVGPHESSDPAAWRTQLSVVLAEGGQA